MHTAAFFDLDGTLLTVNSGRLWAEAERRGRRITREQMAWAMAYLAAYKLGAIDLERAMLQAVRTLVGTFEASLRARTHEWYDSDVRRHAAPGAFGAIADHREKAHRLVLLTSSSSYASERAIEHFGLEAAIATRFEVADGRFTGGLLRPICYGAGKVALAESFAREHEIDLARSYFYTDSITDRPMLERVGNPRVVHPDPRLRLLAIRRGWPVLDWRATNRSDRATNARGHVASRWFR
ncbi:MAG: HAD-IB family hydrolase [Polyangiaceae bacterium]|nr:HAD-IB family hydrolase [Polyangiaceae bacterium]